MKKFEDEELWGWKKFKLKKFEVENGSWYLKNNMKIGYTSWGWAEPNSAKLKVETGGFVVVVRTSFHGCFEYTHTIFFVNLSSPND